MTERRRIGTLSAAALVVANTIGAGVFTTSGFAIAALHTQERVLLAWLCGGALAVYARMAEDGVLPGWLAVGEAVPARAVLFQGAAAIAFAWNADLVEVFGYVGFLLGLSAAATVAALIYGPSRLHRCHAGHQCPDGGARSKSCGGRARQRRGRSSDLLLDGAASTVAAGGGHAQTNGARACRFERRLLMTAMKILGCQRRCAARGGSTVA